MSSGFGGEKSIVWLALMNGAGWLAIAIFGFFTTTVVYRIAGDASFGIWATILSFRNVTLWLDGGLAMGVIRDAALVRTDSMASDRIRAAQLGYRALGLLAIVIGLVASPLPGALLGLSGHLADQARLVTILLAVDAGIALATSPMTAIARGWQRFDVLAIGSMAHAVLGALFLFVGASTAGLVGAAAGLAATRAAVSAGYAVWLWRSDRRLLRAIAGFASATRVLRFATPLWLISFGTILGQSTDVPVVGFFYGSTPAGHFAIGAAVPSVLAGALWVLVDTMYPRLVTASSSIALLPLRLLILAATLLGTLALTTLALTSVPLLRVWIGNDPPLAVQVMVVYAVIWILNMPVHVLSLAAIARDRHQVLAPIVTAEAVANLVLSVALAASFGPIGPAIATLITLAVSNLVVVPWVLVRRLPFDARELIKTTILGFAVGALGGIATWVISLSISDSDLARVVVAAGLPTLALFGLGIIWLRDQSLVYRVAALVLDGGLAEAARTNSEIRAARRRIAVMQTEGAFDMSDPDPLVTVRIATYNRGNLVAERAIASAIGQTYRNLEILVVGDHCDAETEAAVRSVPDPRIVFHNLPERGAYPPDASRRWMVAGAAPMNWALDHARGAWIAPLDDDDEFTPDHVEVLMRAARDQGAEFVYGVADSEDGSGAWRPIGSWPLREGQIIHAAVMYRTELRFLKHSVKSWRLHQPGDWNLWSRMRRAGVRMAFVDRVVVKHYVENREVRGLALTPVPEPA